jgi:hypothetical protein
MSGQGRSSLQLQGLIYLDKWKIFLLIIKASWALLKEKIVAGIWNLCLGSLGWTQGSSCLGTSRGIYALSKFHSRCISGIPSPSEKKRKVYHIQLTFSVTALSIIIKYKHKGVCPFRLVPQPTIPYISLWSDQGWGTHEYRVLPHGSGSGHK